jgi:hypothetical protein
LRRSRQTRQGRCVNPVVDSLYVVIGLPESKIADRNRRLAGSFAVEGRAQPVLASPWSEAAA